MPDIVQPLKERRSPLLTELGKIEKAVKALGSVRIRGKTKRRKPKVSKAGQARIRAVQRKRGAKIRAGK
jgi:hypothetical protein